MGPQTAVGLHTEVHIALHTALHTTLYTALQIALPTVYLALQKLCCTLHTFTLHLKSF